MLDISDADSDFENPKPKKKVAAKTAGAKPAATRKPAMTKKAPAKKIPLADADANMGISDHDSFDDEDDRSGAKAAPSKAKRRVSKNYTEQAALEDIYQKKTPIEHILIRPDTYIGSIEAMAQGMWVYENGKFVVRNVTYVPGLYKIVDEILVNSADNKIRDPSMDTIKVDINVAKGTISVFNNGRGIPIHIHKEENVYIPELIFGHLLTSSNYNDNDKKVVGGRNGYGAKLCNIFSHEFIVETADRAKKYKQVFRDNMSKMDAPIISPNPREEEYTRITFSPDFAKFGMQGIDADLEALLTKRVYDLAGVVKNVKVFLNGERLKVRGFKQYIDMLAASNATEHGEDAAGTNKSGVLFEVSENGRWEVGFALSDGQFQQVSFVNSICTSKGGTHVNHVADAIANKILDVIKKKNKATKLKVHQIRNHIWIFVNCLIENPAFDSQTKETLTSRATSFGSKCELSEEFMKKVLKSGVLENVQSFAKFKENQELKKTDGAKRTRLTGVVKLEDANSAGTRGARNCTLILTEGDSAKALAVSGLAVVGRDNFGVFPLRGKLLNVRDATHAQIMGNAEINQIKQILGLQHGKVYDSVDSLRYGHLMIMTDQDHDGSHIKGLLINFLDHFFPSLLRMPGFLLEFITPIVKVTRASRSVSFYTIPEYEVWKEENNEGQGWTIKYYKGLGTSTKEDAIKYFSALDKHMKKFKTIEQDERELVDMAFSKKRADDRKEWLRQYVPGTHIDHDVEEISIEDFVQKELILFSLADNARSIPSMVDGFKPGQRKVLFGCFKRRLKGEIKVAQLGGYVAEHSAYHHGEQSLTMTIVGLAQDFVGNNNINLLEPRGQFGTRLQGGKDAASARYIFTSLNPITRAIFQPSDDKLLTYLNEDGDNIEPEWYMPVLPMVLVNGSDGIGTGWSSTIPNYNPEDIVDNIRRLMNGDQMESMDPWYRGFKGSIARIGDDKFKVTGSYRIIDDTTLEVTELPIRIWTQNYKEQLESWVTGGDKAPAWVRDYKEYHTDSKVHFVITLSEENMRLAIEEGIEKRFKLSSSLATSNMVCFDSEGRIKKYTSPEQILDEFYHLRLDYYNRRKELLLKQYTREWTKADNRVRFVKEIIQGELVVQNRKRQDVLVDLKSRGYAPMRKGDGDDDENAAADEDSPAGSDHGYDYLLTMPIWNLTWEKIQSLEDEKLVKHNLLRILTAKSGKDLWNEDLDEFLAHWQNSLESYITASEKKHVAKGKGKKNKRDDSDDDFAKPKAKRPSPAKKATKATTLDDFVVTKARAKAPVAPKKTTAYIELSDTEMSVQDRIKELAAAKSSATVGKPAKVEVAANDNVDMDVKPPKAAAKLAPAMKTSLQPKPAAKRAVKRAIKESDEDEDFDDTPKAAVTSKRPQPKSIVNDSDSDKDDFESEQLKSVPVKRAPAKVADKVADDDDEFMEEAATVVSKPAPKKRMMVKKAPPTVRGISGDDKPAKKSAVKPTAALKTKIEDDSEESEPTPLTRKPAAGRATKKTIKYAVSSDEDDDGSDFEG